MDAVLLAAAAGVAAGAAVTVLLILALRLARGGGELGGDAERAAYRALHQASVAAPFLRGGLDAATAARAARPLRVLLGASAVALVSDGQVVAFDGAGEATADALAASAARIAARVTQSGRRQVFSRAEVGAWEAVGAPIEIDGQVHGVVVAFASSLPAPLVRATAEVAQWCAAQLALGELDASRTALAEAQLRSLRAQISPHFIFNALTAIASFVHTDPDRARELVLEFADFTRYSFRRQGEFTTVAEELRSIHSYLALERARFGERLRVTLRISPETLATVIPFLAVQPLVENAVRHGIEPGAGGGSIRICSEDAGTHTEITVEDDGVGMDPAALRELLGTAADGAHVGVRNVDTRLRGLYGPGGGLVIETGLGAGTLVRMRIPKSQPRHETDAP